MNATMLVAAVLASPAGGTLDSETLAPISALRDTYIVALPGGEYRTKKPSPEALRAWWDKASKQVPAQATPTYVGWWLSGEEYVFDIVIVLRGEQALIQAALWGQEAVYSPFTGEVIYI